MFWIKSINGTSISLQLKSISPEKFWITFWQFFRKGWDGCALLVQPSRIPHRISKILYVLVSVEYLKNWKAKLESAYSFTLKYSKITACCSSIGLKSFWTIQIVMDLPNHFGRVQFILSFGFGHVQIISDRSKLNFYGKVFIIWIGPKRFG